MKRDLFWDSLKFVLIFLVVYGHTIENYAPDGSFNRAMYSFIYIFHMPLFIFVSGRFSHIRDRQKYKKRIYRLLETYFVFQTIWTLAFVLQQREFSPKTIAVFVAFPQWTLWYLLSLVYWRIMVYIIPKRILDYHPLGIITASVIISLIGGFIPVSAQFSLQRTMALMPYFFMGYYSTHIELKQFVNKIPFTVAIGFLLSVFLFLYFAMNVNIHWATSCMNSYWSIASKSPILQCVARFILIISATAIGIMVIRIVPTNKSLSRWGNATLFIYLYHTFVIKALRSMIARGYIMNNEILLLLYALAIVFALVLLSRFKFMNIMLNPISYFRNRK